MQFNTLDKSEKTRVINDYAIYVDCFHYYQGWINLYSYSNFFIEAYYEEDNVEIQKIEVASEQAIGKYLSQIIIELPF